MASIMISPADRIREDRIMKSGTLMDRGIVVLLNGIVDERSSWADVFLSYLVTAFFEIRNRFFRRAPAC